MSPLQWLIDSDSTLAKDLNDKQLIYASANILEYWVINVKAKTVMVFREPDGIKYTTCLELNQGLLSPLTFKDLEIPIEKIFPGEILG